MYRYDPMEHCKWCNKDYDANERSIHCPHNPKPKPVEIENNIRRMQLGLKVEMGVGMSHGNNWEELAALTDKLDHLYDTPLTNALVQSVLSVIDELRERHKCQYCGDVTTRWMCDKPHSDIPRY